MIKTENVKKKKSIVSATLHRWKTLFWKQWMKLTNETTQWYSKWNGIAKAHMVEIIAKANVLNQSIFGRKSTFIMSKKGSLANGWLVIRPRSVFNGNCHENKIRNRFASEFRVDMWKTIHFTAPSSTYSCMQCSFFLFVSQSLGNNNNSNTR